MDEKRQVQKELFEDFLKQDKKGRPRDLLQKKAKLAVSLCLEHIIFLFIGFIITLAVVFSIGVERGKSVSLSSAKHLESFKHAKETVYQEPETVDFNQQDSLKEPVVLKDPAETEMPFEFTVQVASYKREDTAKSHEEQLKAQGNDAFVLKKGDYYVTCVGKFRDRQAAESQMKKLRKSYSDCLVRKI